MLADRQHLDLGVGQGVVVQLRPGGAGRRFRARVTSTVAVEVTPSRECRSRISNAVTLVPQ